MYIRHRYISDIDIRTPKMGRRRRNRRRRRRYAHLISMCCCDLILGVFKIVECRYAICHEMRRRRSYTHIISRNLFGWC
jgi:hypothetical protein